MPTQKSQHTAGGPPSPPPPWRIMFMLTILTLTTIITPACGIQCYECVHNNQRVKRHNRFVYPCGEFDGSPRYIMNCPDSRLCIYQRITLTLAKEDIVVTTMDGCTPNVTDHARYAEAGLVKAGCIQHKSAYKPPSTEYCYCGYNLCNSTSARQHSNRIAIAAALTVVLLHCTQWRRVS